MEFRNDEDRQNFVDAVARQFDKSTAARKEVARVEEKPPEIEAEKPPEILAKTHIGVLSVRVLSTPTGKQSQYHSGGEWRPMTAELARQMAKNEPSAAHWLRKHTGLLPTGLIVD